MATYYVRTDGSDSNAGTGPATNQAWQTITKAIGASGIAPGDTLYIAPGVYRGTFTAAFTNPANEGQRITIAGNPTASQFSGISAGPVIITNYTSASSFTTGTVLTILKDFVTLQDINVVTSNPGGTPFYMVSKLNGIKINLTRCQFHQTTSSGELYGVDYSVKAGQSGGTISQCVFLGAEFNLYGDAHTGAWDSQTLISDCIILNTNTNTNANNGVRLTSTTSGQFGGVKIINCYISAQNGIKVAVATSTAFPVVVQNCYIEAASGISALTTGQIVQTYNLIQASVALGNVASSATTLTNVFASYNGSISKIQGWGDYPFISLLSSAQSGINAGINTNSPVSDVYGTTWLAPTTPTIGASEFQSYTPSSTYVPTERNASTITIAPGSTSQSIELYLGVIGLTASTSGLSARYNRTRTASVSIPLVARTIAQAWTAGGFAEVDATNMPGVYRLDLPDAALAAGADDVTVVVRGASGTNGAVMTVKLSSGGLTSAQTASAVWGADVAGYVAETNFGGVVNATRNVSGSTEIIAQDIPSNVWEELTTNHTTHNTFGWNILRADAQSKQGLVTLASSGGTNRVDADIHAIVNDTAAAAELKGALLHTGGDYITADLQTPITSTVSPAIGPFTVLPSGAGADNIVDLNVGSALPLVLNLQDGSGAPFNASGATITATVYTAGGSTVTTYTGSIIAGYIGAISVPLSTAVTATSATYTMLVSVVIGTTTTVFGPLKLVVRAI